MLFNSLLFVFGFLPVVLIGFWILLRLSLRWVLIPYLVCISLLFYGVWNPAYILLLVGSVVVNYLIGLRIASEANRDRSTGLTLTLGVLVNLLLLGYYKYTGFFIEVTNDVLGLSNDIPRIILPLAISFYTFQQIAWLIDVSRREVKPEGIGRYTTFVIFFPQLIAGPIVHYRELIPQFFGRRFGRYWTANIVVGLVIFSIGLFKKAVIADSAALYSSPIFDAVHGGQNVGLGLGWTAAMCYTIQLYFDFSGYSDMAIGLARMFFIKLPPNFHSPLRATSIADYWRRWHMTLQRFIAGYMFQPLALPLARFAATKGLGRWPSFWVTLALPTLFIFIAVGFWHGAGMTFIVFGLMHGIYLTINEAWRLHYKKRRKKDPPRLVHNSAYWLLTLVAVAFANVMFRAESVSDAVNIWFGMVQIHQVVGFAQVLPYTLSECVSKPLVLILLSSFLIFLCPNTQQIMGRYSPVFDWADWKSVAPSFFKFQFRLTVGWALVFGVVLFLGIAFISRGQTEFIYFNF
ncbi:MBOAT family O-acyltransferase [Blastopirellula marina]|uniref:MBOAT family protein n=1 Tax=Blastopirellula marina TaxID=124 RepID=A0A2S8GTX9_9BACT|nr:MBOAT family O-acyltransferase [Blastopirellula marina]PQO47860.1 hypothetical protein C5Y93_02115 [Blastopirellula marina]